MRKEQFVSKATALLAQEKGFDWECREYYDKEFGDEVQTLAYFQNGDGWCSNLDAPANREYGYWMECIAPSQAVLARWLREEHGYEIHVYKQRTKEGHYFGWNSRIPELGASKIGNIGNTWEEAMEGALLETLEQLENARV